MNYSGRTGENEILEMFVFLLLTYAAFAFLV